MTRYESYRTAVRLAPPALQRLWRRMVPTPLRRALRAACNVSHKQIPDTIVATADGRKFRIGPDAIYIPLYHGQAFEPEATGMLKQLLRAGDTVVDAGANFGWYSTLFGKCVGPTGQVYSFEPVPSTYQRLVENIELNELQSVISTVNGALGNRSGIVDIHLFDELSHSLASLSRVSDARATTYQAALQRLDTFLNEQNVERIDFLKCDVEGSELMVMRGAQKYLQQDSAPIIMVEINPDTSAAFGYQPSELLGFLESMGYDHFYAISSAQTLERVHTFENLAHDNIDLLIVGKRDQVQQRLAPCTLAKAS